MRRAGRHGYAGERLDLRVGAALMCLAVAACGETGGGSGAGQDGGAGKPPRAAASILLQPRPGAAGCPSSALVTVPSTASEHLTCDPGLASCTPTREAITDGEGGDVSCAVRRDGDGYAISGSISHLDFHLGLHTLAPIPETGGTATVSVQKAFGEMPMVDRGCTVTIKAIVRGSVWGVYSCPAMGEEASPQPVCVATGSFAFENCDG